MFMELSKWLIRVLHHISLQRLLDLGNGSGLCLLEVRLHVDGLRVRALLVDDAFCIRTDV